MFFKNDRKQIRIQPGKELSYHMKKNSTKWNSRAERGCRTATSSMRASAHPPEGFCMIGKFGELSYHMKKNSTKWNSRAEARLRQQTFSLGAKCASPGGLFVS